MGHVGSYFPMCLHAKLLYSCLTLCDAVGYSLPGSSVHGDSSGKNTGVGCHALLQGIVLTQGLEPLSPPILNCRQILYPEPPGKPLSSLTKDQTCAPCSGSAES